VVTAEQWVPSGITALMVASEPFWVIVLNWLRPRGEAPTARIVLGLALGFAGVFFLVSPFHSGVGVELRGALVLVGATLCWASGSLYSRKARLPKTPWMSAACQMLAGGALLVAAGSALGQWSRLDLAAVSTKSVLAIAYLVVFGALVAFSAYAWILRVAHPAAASTYAFVNPLVAVLLGWLFAGEEVSTTLGAGGLILLGVVLITAARSRGVTRLRRRASPS
jgi:drug/metabolite transporter (DMT)-like permease